MARGPGIANGQAMQTSKTALAASLGVHGCVVALLFIGVTVATLPPPRLTTPVWIPTRMPERLFAPAPGRSGGGGGAGTALPPSRGQLPKVAPRPFVPPAAETKPAVLYLEPAIAAPPPWQQAAVDLDRYGDPFGQTGAYSDGPGKGGGIGTGRRGGFGPGEGPGVGEGTWGSGTGRAVGGATPRE